MYYKYKVKSDPDNVDLFINIDRGLITLAEIPPLLINSGATIPYRQVIDVAMHTLLPQNTLVIDGYSMDYNKNIFSLCLFDGHLFMFNSVYRYNTYLNKPSVLSGLSIGDEPDGVNPHGRMTQSTTYSLINDSNKLPTYYLDPADIDLAGIETYVIDWCSYDLRYIPIYKVPLNKTVTMGCWYVQPVGGGQGGHAFIYNGLTETDVVYIPLFF